MEEWIANAVIHRSYLEPSRVQVALYDDRLEITSPGMLIGGFTIEDLKAGCCQARNRGIVNALTYMKIIEQWGSGIPRLLENCKSAGLREPELLEIGGSFRVNMFRNTELASSNSGEVREKDGITKEKKRTEEKNRRKEQKKRTEKSTEIIERTEKIWELICKNPNITQSAMMEELGISRKKVQLALEKLISDGKIERVGSDRSGSWKVSE